MPPPVNWPVRFRAALFCLPALAICFAAGIARGDPAPAVAAAAGAFLVGLGAFHRATRYRILPMALGAPGMAISTAIGSLAGHWPIAVYVVSVLWAGLCGSLASRGKGVWWIGLQWSIGLFVGIGFPAPLQESAIRAGWMLGGGALQLAIVVGSWHWFRLRWPAPVYRWQVVGAPLPFWQGPLPVALAVLLAILAAGQLDLGHRYWAPLSALITIQPGFSETASRALYRGLGTLAGAAVATFAEVLLQPGLPLIALLCLLFAWLSYVLQRLHYAAFVASLTAFLVFMLEFSGLPEVEGARERILAVLVGIAVSLSVAGVMRIAASLKER